MALIDPCDDILLDLQWDKLSDDEHAEMIEDWMEGLLADWGLEEVSIEFGKSTEGTAGDYDPNSNTITLDPQMLGGDPMDWFEVAAHEVGHAIQQDNLGDQLRNQNPNPDDPYTTSQVDANEFAAAVLEDVTGDCMDPDSESASNPNAPKGDWNLPAGHGAYA